MGATIFILAFVETWLGIVPADRNKLVWSAFLFVSPSFSAIQKLKESLIVPALYVLWRYDGAEKVWMRAGGREGRVYGVAMSVVGNMEFAYSDTQLRQLNQLTYCLQM